MQHYKHCQDAQGQIKMANSMGAQHSGAPIIVLGGCKLVRKEKDIYMKISTKATGYSCVHAMLRC